MPRAFRSFVVSALLFLAACGIPVEQVVPDVGGAGADTGVVDHPDSDAGTAGTPSPGFVECGADLCDVATESCCLTEPEDGSGTTFACLASGTTCEGLTQTCDEPADCEASSPVCCRPTGTAASECVASDGCSDSGARVRCQVDSDCPEETPACCASSTTSGGSCRTACSRPAATDAGEPSPGDDAGVEPGLDAGAEPSDAEVTTEPDASEEPDDAGPTPEDAGLSSADAGSSATGSPTPGLIDCGAASCDALSEVCCATSDPSASDTCLGLAEECLGTSIGCDEPGDCASGEVCCRPTGTEQSECLAEADCSGGGARERCHVDADCPSSAPVCCPSSTTSGGSCRTSCGTSPSADAGTPAPQADAGAGSTGLPTPGIIDCGDSSCDTATELCCATGSGGSTAYECLASTETCGGTAIACDEPGDCASGEVCCRPSNGLESVCEPTDSCTTRVRCHTDEDCPATSPQCCPSSATSGGSCRPAGSC